MPEVNTWDEFAERVTAYLHLPAPFEAMQKDGFTFAGAVGDAVRYVKPARTPVLSNAAGSQPQFPLTNAAPLSVRLKIGGPGRPPPTIPPVVPQYPIALSMNLQAINAVLQQLWQVGTISNQLSAAETTGFITLEQLRQVGSNVPTSSSAQIGGLKLNSAPVLSKSLRALTDTRVSLGISLPVMVDAQAVSLDAMLHVEVPLALTNLKDANGLPSIGLDTSNRGNAATATIDVAINSAIQPASSAAQTQLEGYFSSAAQNLLEALTLEDVLLLPAQVTLPKPFANTIIGVSNAGAVTCGAAPNSFAVLGINILAENQGAGIVLAKESLPSVPYNVRARVSDGAASDALMQFVTSGDIAAFVNKLLSDKSLPVTVQATSASVSFQNGIATASVSFVAPNACIGISDMNFTASLTGPPVISNGSLLIGAQYLGIDIDTGEEAVCVISVGLLSPLLGAALAVGLASASSSKVIGSTAVPASFSITPLSGTQTNWTIAMQKAYAEDSMLILDGVASLAVDTVHTFIYLSIVYAEGARMIGPVANAHVTLFELDDPAPAGDDVLIPKTGTTETVTQKFVTQTTVTYLPSPDQSFGTHTADANGLVEFAVLPNDIGGHVTTTKTQTDVHAGSTPSTTTTTDPVLEGRPDFGVSITDANGRVLATRRLVVLNASSKVLGSREDPIVVPIEQPIILGGGGAAHP